MLSLSTASPGQTSASLPSSLSNVDAVHSFKLFLDLITPAELSKLLRRRLIHILSNWPPQSSSAPTSFISSSSSRTGHPSSLTLQSIEAFATFFRPQYSPPPSPPDISSRTSLDALHHRLVALQTLLSFLSPRELKDVVRSRLSEAGKDRSVAVQGLMDVMQNPREDGSEDFSRDVTTRVTASKKKEFHLNTKDDIADATLLVETVSSTFSEPNETMVQRPIDTKLSAPANSSSPTKREGNSIQKICGRPSVDDHISLQSTPISLLNPEHPITSPSQRNQTLDTSSIDTPETRVQHRPRIRTPDADCEILNKPQFAITTVGKLKDSPKLMDHSLGSPFRHDDCDGSSLASRVEDVYPVHPGKRKQLYIDEMEEGDFKRFANEGRNHYPASDASLEECHGVEHDELSHPRENAVEIGTSPLYSPRSPISDSSISLSRSRSHSISFHRSISDRASPPGPMLRTAVDWANGISSAVDKGPEHPLAFTPGTMFGSENDGTFNSHIFAPKSRHPSGSWDGYGESQDSDHTNDPRIDERQKKLVIRLPARRKAKTGISGVAAEDVTETPSTTAPGSPIPEHGANKSGKFYETEPMEASSSGETDRMAEKSKPMAVNSTSPSITPSTVTTPNIAAPHAQYPVQFRPTSGPHPGSPGALSAGPYALPPSAYAPQPHPYPWFGAMFYVPFHGHPHTPAAIPVPASSSRQLSDATPSSHKMPADRREGSSEPSAGPSSSTAPAPVTRKRVQKRPEQRKRGPIEPPSPPSPVLDPDVTYTDDIGVKESAIVRRRCYNCHSVQAPSWRKSKLNFGKILCNKCGIYESTHMSARPLKTRPRRSHGEPEGEYGPPKKRRLPKKSSNS